MLISAFYQSVMKMDTKSGKLTQLEIPDLQRCIRKSVYIPTDMHQDANGNVWIGTVSNGLLRYNPQTNRRSVVLGCGQYRGGCTRQPVDWYDEGSEPSGHQDGQHHIAL